MSLLDLLNHLLNFVAPALAVGFLCALMGRVFVRKAAGAPRWWIQGAINFGVGALVLLGGLVLFGRDGAMATYVALVLACGTSQWCVSGGWRG
jgi:TRAP-type C4-dicarboxylate transport system permease small subunit